VSGSHGKFGTRSKIGRVCSCRWLVWDFYWQHSIDVIPRWLSLVAGWSWNGITTLSVANVSTLPWTAVQTPAQYFVHRLAAVVKVTKGISLYAMDGTSFSPPISGNVLQSGLLPPVILGKGQELGMKTSLFNDRLSVDFAWFKLITTNQEVPGGYMPSGLLYYNIVGFTLQEGVDGDFSLSLYPGWQMIGTFYAGHNRDQTVMPLATSYDNSWSVFTRYTFQRDSSLYKWAVGTGFSRIGGRWVGLSGMNNAVFTAYNLWSGEVKVASTEAWDAFVTYAYNPHLSFKFDCENILNKAFPQAAQTLLAADASIPRNYYFEATYKF